MNDQTLDSTITGITPDLLEKLGSKRALWEYMVMRRKFKFSWSNSCYS